MNLVQKIILFFLIGFILLGSLLYFLLAIIPIEFLLFYLFIVAVPGLIVYYYAGALGQFKQSAEVKIKRNNLYQSPEINPILFSARSVFPFDLFPDKYLIQEKSITIIRKKFFFTAWTETIPHKDLVGVRIYTGPFFASITLIKKILPQNTVELRTLWKKDAIKMKEILDAVILKEDNIIKIPEALSSNAKRDILIDIGKKNEIEKEI